MHLYIANANNGATGNDNIPCKRQSGTTEKAEGKYKNKNSDCDESRKGVLEGDERKKKMFSVQRNAFPLRVRGPGVMYYSNKKLNSEYNTLVR